MGQEVRTSTRTPQQAQPQTISILNLLKNNPSFVIGFCCSFTISAVFFFLNRLMFKSQFLETLEATLPRYKEIVYSMGNVFDVDSNRLVIRDDFDEEYFKTNPDGSISLNMQKILEVHNVIQSLTNKQQVNLEQLVSYEDLDPDLFEMDKKTGQITIDLDYIFRKKRFVETTGSVYQLDTDRLLSQDDFDISRLGTAEETNNVLDTKLDSSTIIFDKNAREYYRNIFEQSEAVKIRPFTPLIIKLQDDCNLEDLKDFIKRFENIIVDLSQYKNKDEQAFKEMGAKIRF